MASWFVAVLTVLDPNAQLLGVILAVGQCEIGYLAAFSRFTSVVVGGRAGATGNISYETFYRTSARLVGTGC
jgi:hypothetical protein